MSNKQYIVKKYTEDMNKRWDKFVNEKSINGTFLQTRNFLNYHPNGKFKDASYIIYDEKMNIAAVFPACELNIDNINALYSHMGSTFGGIIIDQSNYDTQKLIDIISALEEKSAEDGFQQIFIKVTPTLYAKESNELLQYCLYYCGYKEYKELNHYIDYSCYGEDVLSQFKQGKRYCVHKCEKNGMVFRQLTTKEEIEIFYNILCESLQKYNVRPVHSYEELLDFKMTRLQKECDFFGTFLEGKMVAGAMLFYFNHIGVAHTQYLAALREFDSLSPMTYLYYKLIIEMRKNNFKALSWGISTEDQGKVINWGLTRSKEAYGGTHTLNCSYFKVIG